MKKLLVILLSLTTPAWCGTINTTAGTGSIATQAGTGSITFTAAAVVGGGSNSDSFTGSDTTLLATHDSNWTTLGYSGHAVANCELQSNTVNSNSGASGCAALYNTSSSDSSQIVFKVDNTSGDGYKGVCTRGSASVAGYCATFTTPSGGNWTAILVTKNESYLGSCTSLSYNRTTDHTIKIKASGTGTVTLDVYIDGSLDCTKTDSSSAIASGKPGFYGMQASLETRGQLDDWTDAP